jgi:replicative DNA helicase
MLTSRTFAQYAAEELAATDFARPTHQTVFAAIQHMLTGPRPRRVDEGTVIERLHLDERLDGVGGAVFVHSLAEAAPSPEAADHYLEIVRHLAILRGERPEAATIPTIRDTLSETLAQIERLHEDHKGLTGVPTGFPYLDRLTSGLQPGKPNCGRRAPVSGQDHCGDGLRPACHHSRRRPHTGVLA